MMLVENVHLSLSRYYDGADQPWKPAHLLSLECFMHVKLKCVLVGEGSSHWWSSFHSCLLDVLTPDFLEFFTLSHLLSQVLGQTYLRRKVSTQ